MSKNKTPKNRTFQKPTNKQQKLANKESSINGSSADINQVNKIEKEALGPNTYR